MAIRIGMIGTGWFGKKHAEILSAMDGVQIAAVCGTSKAKAAHMAAELSIPSSFDKVTDMLDAGPLDAVYISVPPLSHGEMELQRNRLLLQHSNQLLSDCRL